MIFSLSDIKQQIDTARFNEGLEFFKDRRVSAPNIQHDGKLITAIIQQNTRRPMRIYVRTEQELDSTRIYGECSCSKRKNCEHVVAVLLQALDDAQELPERISTSTNRPDQKRRTSARVLKPVRSSYSKSKQVLLYSLHIDSGEVLIETLVARCVRQSHYSIVAYFEASKITARTPARFLQAIDLELLASLKSFPRYPGTGIPILKGNQSGTLLEEILATGRCYFDTPENNTPLTKGSKRGLELSWKVDDFGFQHLDEQISPQASALLSISPPWYLDKEKRECGPLCGETNSSLIHELIDISPISPEQAEKSQKTLLKKWPDTRLPSLKTFDIKIAQRVEPVPCLRLTTVEKKLSKDYSEYSDFASLSFYYDEIEINLHDPSTLIRNGQLIRVQRNKKIENKTVKRLRQSGFNEDEGWSESTGKSIFTPVSNCIDNEAETWLDFQQDSVPALLAEGWKIEYDDFRYRLIKADNWFCEIDKLKQQDWFNIGMGVEVNGQRIELLPILLEFLHQLPAGLPAREDFMTENFILPHIDKQNEEYLVCLPVTRVLPLLEILLEVYDSKPLSEIKQLHFNRAQLARLTALDQSSDSPFFKWLVDDDVQHLLQQLHDVDCIPPVPPPATLTATLRPYQQQGLNWLQFLRKFQLAGILADDMGLGKTVQALAHLLIEKESGRADRPGLIIAPTSLMFNWRQEAERFAPQLKVLVLHGPKRKTLFPSISSYDLIITTYPLLVRDKSTLLAYQYHLLILDEAQVIKNPAAQASRVVREINARHRLCLTGTPLENHLGELWSLFDFLLPGLLGTKKQFRKFFRSPIEKEGDDACLERLSSRIRPFLLRRTKQQVATDLPMKTEITQPVILQGKQRELYESVRLAMHKRVQEEISRKGLARIQITVLDALLKLRQVCCHPGLLKMQQAKNVRNSAKLTMLMELVPELVEEGRRILIFSQFTTMLGYIEDELKNTRIKYVKLTGRTRDRETPVKQFQQGKVPVFLISLKAGGVGLNLTAADTVIHYDPWWNPAVERQATDRAHRIGQQQKVFVYKLICLGTVEEKIQNMQQTKQDLADSLYQNGNSEPGWSEEDFQTLFAPLEEA